MKFLKWTLIVIGVLALLFFFVIGPYMKTQTKKHSPEQSATYVDQDSKLDLLVNYNSPSKKGRVIFGELVPYDQVWRTGANEPTTMTTNSTIAVKGKNLPAGTYSIWTIPREKKWTVIFNSNIPDWGVSLGVNGMEPSWDEAHDVIKVEVPVEDLKEVVENFTIDFTVEDQLYLTLAWDTTKVRVPISTN
ncbi:DUF2911 domain-containing protein [Spongiimicrobium salis]|uniref:DUF2911 domain-containing protein n=1 Tax=Spongiimicrobium salis TaxID=1667022 RepID=UPI00374CED26